MMPSRWHVQMPPKAITRQAWTPAERLGARLLGGWAMLIVAAVVVIAIVWLR